ncbi:MAG: hypothetical protein KAY46_15770 [Burkholderiaceae bacterium]|nr:hypothetical protein [Burkholderiaceae bacterium]
MAARLNIRNSPSLPHIWNVSQRVGPGSDDPNLGTDVQLLNALVAIALGHPQIKRFGINGDSPTPSRGTKFDPVLGFWIFRIQQLGAQPGDGVASPARGINFGPGSPWVVVTINRFAKEADPDLWASLDRNTFLSPQLRAELSRSS